jgi:hypothetical protein
VIDILSMLGLHMKTVVELTIVVWTNQKILQPLISIHLEPNTLNKISSYLKNCRSGNSFENFTERISRKLVSYWCVWFLERNFSHYRCSIHVIDK